MKRLVLALAMTGAALSAADYLAWRSGNQRVLERAVDSGIVERQPDLPAALAREPVFARAAAATAWRLLDLEIDRQWLSELSPEERRTEVERGGRRLALAAELAVIALDRQPASWRAAAVLGASRYLLAFRQTRQEQPASTWSAPLEAAARLAPGHPEPPALLASFYLSRWASLDPAERRRLTTILARAFRDPQSFERLLPAWVRLAPSLGRLFEPIPDRPEAWQRLGTEFLRLGDLERYGTSHRRRLEALQDDLGRRVEAGRDRLRGGHPRAGLGLLRSVFSTPPDLAYVESFSAALIELPPEAVDRDTGRHLRTWLLWANDLCAVGRCPLAPATRARLSELAAESAAPAAAHREATARRAPWSAGDWLERGDAYRLPLEVGAAADRLRLDVAGVPPEGTVLEVRWNGRMLGVEVVQPSEPLVQRLSVDRGTHLLEVRQLTGHRLRPLALSLDES